MSLDHSQLSVFEALERSWRHFGGVTEELLVDRAREMVLDPTVTPVVWNPRFLELCGHYGIRPVACRGRRPQTKGVAAYCTSSCRFNARLSPQGRIGGAQ